MNAIKKSLAALAVVGALMIPAAGAFAQTATNEATEDTTTEVAPDDRHASYTQALAEGLAAELDVPVADVTAALEAVQADLAAQRQAERRAALQEELDAAVEAGDLTQEQADALLAAEEAGISLGGRGRHGGHGGFDDSDDAEQEETEA